MSSNDSSNDSCLWYQTTGKDAALSIVYGIFFPIHFFLGMFGHIICLIAYRQRAKQQKAYMYQVFVTISESFEITTYTLGIAISEWWSGRLSSGQMWFMSSYICMGFYSYINLPLANTFITSSSLFSLAMAADRVFAITNGIKYKTCKHTKIRVFVVIGCMALSVSTSFFDYLRYNVVQNEERPGLFKLVPNRAFIGSETSRILSSLRNSIRVASTLCLLGCNVVLVYTYRVRTRKVGQLTSNNTNQKEMQRKRDERMLTFLAIFQSCSSILSTGSMIIHQCVAYVSAEFVACVGDFLEPLTDGITELSAIMDFYILLALSKSFRDIVTEGLRAMRRGIGGLLTSSTT